MRGLQIKKFGGLEPWRCEAVIEIVAPEIGPQSFGTLEKQIPAQSFSLPSCGRISLPNARMG